MSADQGAAQTTAAPIPAVERQLMKETWEAMPHRDGNALRLLDAYNALADRERALVAALRIAHDFCCDFEEERPCTTENCQVQAALDGQPVAQDEAELKAMAATALSLSTQLGQKIEQEVEWDAEVARLREHIEAIKERASSSGFGTRLWRIAAIIELCDAALSGEAEEPERG